jgi:hypothetical protein
MAFDRFDSIARTISAPPKAAKKEMPEEAALPKPVLFQGQGLPGWRLPNANASPTASTTPIGHRTGRHA